MKSRWDDDDDDNGGGGGGGGRAPAERPAKRARAAAAAAGVAASREPCGFPLLSGCRAVQEHYEFLNHIADGSYGSVHRARCRGSGDIVALKRIKFPAGTTEDGFPKAPLREITLLLRLRHPNVIRVREMVAGPGDELHMVMEFAEHDLKGLMSVMPTPFLESEVKCIVQQLLLGLEYLHRNWVMHRDLKPSNILLSRTGILKIADFGMARTYGEPAGRALTGIVCTLWYRAPEVLLGATQYGAANDLWSLACIFGELVTGDAFLPGEGEPDQLRRIVQLLGAPSDSIWPGYSSLPHIRSGIFGGALRLAASRHSPDALLEPRLRRFQILTGSAFDLLRRLFAYDPDARITAADALRHPYFSEVPLPKDPALLPTYPSTNEGKVRRRPSPNIFSGRG